MRKGCLLPLGFVSVVVLLIFVAMALPQVGIWGPREMIGGILGKTWDRVAGCRTETLSRVPSPKKDFVAEVDLLECGEYIINVSVSRSSNVHDSAALLGAWYRGSTTSNASVQWSDASTLRVSFQGATELIYFKGDPDWDGLHIDYAITQGSL